MGLASREANVKLLGFPDFGQGGGRHIRALCFGWGMLNLTQAASSDVMSPSSSSTGDFSRRSPLHLAVNAPQPRTSVRESEEHVWGRDRTARKRNGCQNLQHCESESSNQSAGCPLPWGPERREPYRQPTGGLVLASCSRTALQASGGIGFRVQGLGHLCLWRLLRLCSPCGRANPKPPSESQWPNSKASKGPLTGNSSLGFRV